MHNEAEKLQSKATGFKRFSGWAGGTAALLALAAGVIMGAYPDTPGQQYIANEAYTLVLTANPDMTQVAYGESVVFTASLTCNDPFGPTSNVVSVKVNAGKGDDTNGFGSVSTPVKSIEHGPNKIAVTARGPGNLTLSRSIDVIRVTVGAGSTDCVHTAEAQIAIDENQSYSPAGYDWTIAPEERLIPFGSLFNYPDEICYYFPYMTEPGIYAVKATSKNLKRCHDETNAVVFKVDLDIEGVADEDEADAPGGLICVTNGPGQTVTRKQITINKCEPASWDGHVTLDWAADNVKVYSGSTGGDEVTSGVTYANASLPKDLWVEGTAPSAAAGDVVFRLNPVEMTCPNAASGCDRVVMTAIKVESTTVATTPTDQTRTDIGVAEEVNLVATPGIEDGTWSLSGGGELSPTNGPTTTFTAPSKASVCTVSFNIGGISCDTVFTVFEPSGVVAATINSTFHYPSGVAGAKMHLFPIVVGPTNVSFYQVRCVEVGRDATKCVGYWVTNAAPSHISNGADEWFPLDQANRWPANWDYAGIWYVSQPWYNGGSFEWPIPANWQIGATGATNSMSGWNQEFELQSNGTVTIRKLGNWVTRTTNDVITTN